MTVELNVLLKSVIYFSYFFLAKSCMYERLRICGFWGFLCTYVLRFSDVSIGGKGSTDFVVKCFHQDVPREFIDKLKAICQV